MPLLSENNCSKRKTELPHLPINSPIVSSGHHGAAPHRQHRASPDVEGAAEAAGTDGFKITVTMDAHCQHPDF
jgi:hypothetical protein